MRRRLPPLNALKAFEAAGRHLSFARAADELHVTPAAISHQVKSLEDHLGIQLFRRLPHGLLLTDAGQTCLPKIGKSLDDLVAAIDSLQTLEKGGVLTLSLMQSFAVKWLVPRLPLFQDRHPEIDLHISTTMRLVDFARDNIDIAIRYGQGNWRDLHADLLRTETLFPVCSPALLEGPHPLKTPDDLRHHQLLHDDSWKTVLVGAFPDWGVWLKAAGIDDIDPARGLSLTPSDMVIQAAINAQGVALGRSVLVEADLDERRLVKPFDSVLELDYAYYLVCPETTYNRPKVTAFREWILEEARKQETDAC